MLSFALQLNAARNQANPSKLETFAVRNFGQLNKAELPPRL